jgi:hypothetical protein
LLELESKQAAIASPMDICASFGKHLKLLATIAVN